MSAEAIYMGIGAAFFLASVVVNEVLRRHAQALRNECLDLLAGMEATEARTAEMLRLVGVEPPDFGGAP